jgi:hypothetical protein
MTSIVVQIHVVIFTVLSADLLFVAVLGKVPLTLNTVHVLIWIVISLMICAHKIKIFVKA